MISLVALVVAPVSFIVSLVGLICYVKVMDDISELSYNMVELEQELYSLQHDLEKQQTRIRELQEQLDGKEIQNTIDGYFEIEDEDIII